MFNRPDRIHTIRIATLANIAAIALVAMAAACGDSRSRDARASTEDPQESLTESDYGDLDSTEIRLLAPWSRNGVSKAPNQDAEPARLTAVSTERLAEYDRVVFTFEDRVPGYRLAFVTESGGGCDGTEAVGGAPAHLAVEFERAVSNDEGVPLVEDRDRKTRFPTLVGATQSCDDGNKVRWLLASRGETDYRFLVMAGKPRLILDLRHP